MYIISSAVPEKDKKMEKKRKMKKSNHEVIIYQKPSQRGSKI